jgi:hypothetical protein
MPSRDPKVRTISGRLAAVERHHPDADTSELRRDLRAARAEEYVRALVDGFPPLTSEQRTRLALLLRASSRGGADATA